MSTGFFLSLGWKHHTESTFIETNCFLTPRPVSFASSPLSMPPQPIKGGLWVGRTFPRRTLQHFPCQRRSSEHTRYSFPQAFHTITQGRSFDLRCSWLCSRWNETERPLKVKSLKPVTTQHFTNLMKVNARCYMNKFIEKVARKYFKDKPLDEREFNKSQEIKEGNAIDRRGLSVSPCL